MATADHVIQAQKGIKESFETGAKTAFDLVMKLPIFNVKGNPEWTSIFTSMEGFSGTKILTENEQPPVANLQDGYSVNITKQRYGVGYVTTEDDMQKMGDKSTNIDAFLVEQRNMALDDVKYKFVESLHDFLNYATVTTNYACPGGTALLSASHAWKSGATFDNYITGALSVTNVDSLFTKGSLIKDGAGKEMRVSYDTIVVKENSTAHREAIKLFASTIAPTKVADVNIYEGTVRIVATPYIDSAKAAYWFALDSKKQRYNPLYAGVGQYPTYKEPKLQDNESVLQNVTSYWMQGIITEPFMLGGSDGTT